MQVFQWVRKPSDKFGVTFWTEVVMEISGAPPCEQAVRKREDWESALGICCCGGGGNTVWV